MNGRELEQDLAAFLANGGQWMVWTQLPLGSVVFDRPGVADVYAILKSFSSVSVRLYEVKISKSDFLADVQMGKYLKYLDCCTQFYFAAPAGLLTKDDLPVGCGLITRSEDKGWHVAKAPRRNDFEWDTQILLKLLMRGHADHFAKVRSLIKSTYEDDRLVCHMARGRGAELAKRLASAESYIADAEEIRAQIESSLGEPIANLGDGLWRVRNEVAELLNKRAFAAEAVQMAKLTMDMFNGQHLSRQYVINSMRGIAAKIEGGANVQSGVGD